MQSELFVNNVSKQDMPSLPAWVFFMVGTTSVTLGTEATKPEGSFVWLICLDVVRGFAGRKYHNDL